MELTRIRVSDDTQIQTLSALADEIYHEYYSTIEQIRPEQIDYMCEEFLSFDALKDSIENEGYDYYLFADGDTYAGFYGVHPAEDGVFLSKFYVHKTYRGHGLGRILMNDVFAYAKAKDISSVWLTCNKFNSGSLEFYYRMGYVVEDSVETDIGKGFIMDDYVLRYHLEGDGGKSDPFAK